MHHQQQHGILLLYLTISHQHGCSFSHDIHTTIQYNLYPNDAKENIIYNIVNIVTFN